MLFDVTDRAAAAWSYFDGLLDRRIERISELSGVSPDHFVKINPVDFAEKNKFQIITGHEYKNIRDYIVEQKKDAETFLISPVDSIRETAAQCSYKSGTEIRRTLRASKCTCEPCPVELAQDFFIRNHRQSAPNIRKTAVCFALVYRGEMVAVMLYDISNGAVRGRNRDYELVRLAISKGTRIHGGASKLQGACEDVLRQMGIKKIYSYSNATINSGAVYEKLGFVGTKVDGGQPFVILNNNKIIRLISLYPRSTDKQLAQHGWIKTHLGGNRVWKKEI